MLEFESSGSYDSDRSELEGLVIRANKSLEVSNVRFKVIEEVFKSFDIELCETERLIKERLTLRPGGWSERAAKNMREVANRKFQSAEKFYLELRDDFESSVMHVLEAEEKLRDLKEGRPI